MKPTVLVDIYSSYTACRLMHATTFSVLFTYPTLTRGKVVRVGPSQRRYEKSPHSIKLSLPLDATIFSLIKAENRV